MSKISNVVLNIAELLIMQRGHAIKVNLPDGATMFISIDTKLVEACNQAGVQFQKELEDLDQKFREQMSKDKKAN